jgi:hypothetical protein
VWEIVGDLDELTENNDVGIEDEGAQANVYPLQTLK